MDGAWDAAALGELPASGVLTLGVAVPVPEPWASELHRRRAESGDPVAAAVPPHVTIVPPVTVTPEGLSGVIEHVRRLATGIEPFEIVLDGPGSFRPTSQVVFVRLGQGAEECDDIQQQVRTGPLQRRLAFPYHPHVTVAHDVSAEALDATAEGLVGFWAAWRVGHLSVYRCEEDGVWRPLAHLPLGGCDADRPMAG